MSTTEMHVSQEDKTPGVQAEGFEDQWTVDNSDSDGGSAARQVASADPKAFSNLRARLALAGYTLDRTDADDGPTRFFVMRWGMLRELPDMAAARAFAEQVGVRHG